MWCVHVSAGSCREQKRTSDLLELSLRKVVGRYTYMQGIQQYTPLSCEVSMSPEGASRERKLNLLLNSKSP